jgi:lipoprotein-releasing system permease protein
MRISSFIARRYLFSKNNPNAINIISGISVMGFAVGAMALVTVLSVFNGFESLVQSLYNSFDPDLKITVVQGKVFQENAIPLEKIRGIEGVGDLALVLEENVALRYDERQTIATMKGVSPGFSRINKLDSMMYEGQLLLQRGETDYAVPGYGVAARLGVSPYNDFARIGIYVPKRGKAITYNPEKALNQEFVYPSGIFNIDDDLNNKYILLPLRLARRLMDYDTEISAVEIRLNPDARHGTVKKQIKALLGNNFEVKDRQEQQEILYKVFRYEKWATALIMGFIMILLTFTVISSLTMLVMEKRRDISVLRSMGAGDGMLRWIFLKEGLLIALMGGCIGLLAGFAVCYLQQEYGIIGFGGMETFIINAYPVKMKWMDFMLIFIFILFLGICTSWLPALKAVKMRINFRK